MADRAVTWTTSDEGITSVNATGLVTAVAVGQVTVTATSEGKTGTTLLTVSAVAVASVAVTPPPAAIAEGETTVLVATAKDANGATLPGRRERRVQGPDSTARPGTSIALDAALARARGAYFDGKRTYQMRSILVGAAEAIRDGSNPAKAIEYARAAADIATSDSSRATPLRRAKAKSCSWHCLDNLDRTTPAPGAAPAAVGNRSSP